MLPEPVLEPMPLVPLEPLVLPAPDGLLLLGEALEPVEPLEDDEPCVDPSASQREHVLPRDPGGVDGTVGDAQRRNRHTLDARP